MSTMHTAVEVFDRGKFLANVDGNLELMQEVVNLFLADCPRRLAALHNAVAQGDRTALEHAAHMLKGSAGYIGASAVFTAALEVETIARCGDLADAHHACAKLQRETRHLEQVLASL
jgi:HPt (histidine-containing phosphotransfer) domain-containing protein